jgi:hypothetical protein
MSSLILLSLDLFIDYSAEYILFRDRLYKAPQKAMNNRGLGLSCKREKDI